MILFELLGNEAHPVYQDLQVSNGSRQYDFLQALVRVSLEIQKDHLSLGVIKALNFHAITCLHVSSGEYRPCTVTVGDYHPPQPHQVAARMEDFVDTVNRHWEKSDPVGLAAFVLWKLNGIHPFINGNGRTARAACYLVLCLKLSRWLPGTTILPELIRRDRDDYVAALKVADQTNDLSQLHALLSKLLSEQIQSSSPPPPPPPYRFNKRILDARRAKKAV
jgi:hypothetical protein